MRLFDLHCDTLYECATKNLDLYANDLQLSLKDGLQYHPWGQTFAIWMPNEKRGQDAFDHFDRCYHIFQEQLKKHEPHMIHCIDGKDILAAEQAGKCAAVLSVEGGAATGGQIERLALMRRLGVRLLTLTWNGSCEIGDGAVSEKQAGLTAFGLQAVAACERLGIIVDVSHLSEKGFFEVAEMATHPFVATHSNASAVFDCPRNLTDVQFALIRDSGGLVGINFCPYFVCGRENDATFEEIERHIAHFLDHGGEKTICIGTDFDGAPMPSQLSGIDKLTSFAEYLLTKGYSESIIDCFFYKNARDFLVNTLTSDPNYTKI